MSGLTRHTCVVLCLVGSLLFMAGLALAMVITLLGTPTGWPKLATAAWGLVLGGLCCGALMSVLLAAGSRRRAPAVGAPADVPASAVPVSVPAAKPAAPSAGPGQAGLPQERDDPFALPGVRSEADPYALPDPLWEPGYSPFGPSSAPGASLLGPGHTVLP